MAAVSAKPTAGPSLSLGSRVEAMDTETMTSASPTPAPASMLLNNLSVPTSSSGGGVGVGVGPSSLSHELIPSRVATPSRPHLQSMSSHSGSMSDSGSMYSASAPSSKGGLSSLFARRGSLLSSGVRRPKSVGSNRSRSSVAHSHDDGASSQSQSYEMQPVRGHGKKHVMQNHEARMDRRKAEAAVSKWRKWIVEQPASAAPQHPLYTGLRGETPLHSTGTPTRTPPASIKINTLNGEYSASARGSIAGPSSGSQPEAGPSSAEPYTSVPGTPTSHHQLVPGALDIYTTESVRVLRDVELAVDPEYFGNNTAQSPTSRARRLSSHPRLSDMENPFSSIDTLLSRRGIRPLVLELVHALGAYIDAVWTMTYPNRPCPWAGMPMSLAARRASLIAKSPRVKTWRSWTLTAVQEGKRRGLLPHPTERDVLFWGWEIRYGLRDIDEAVNRRKDLGWAFGESVVQGQYGDITPANVLTGEGRGGNVARLLNDLEEALWGDAIPPATDLAFEYEEDFDPFSVYREGDELVGVEMNKQAADREEDLRKVFGDSFVSQIQTSTPPVAVTPRERATPPSPANTPVGKFEAPELDFSALGVLQGMSMEEKLELGRRRHLEYLQRNA